VLACRAGLDKFMNTASIMIKHEVLAEPLQSLLDAFVPRRARHLENHRQCHRGGRHEHQSAM
jgi:hypothetical protein